jgi:hypothetical protein
MRPTRTESTWTSEFSSVSPNNFADVAKMKVPVPTSEEGFFNLFLTDDIFNIIVNLSQKKILTNMKIRLKTGINYKKRIKKIHCNNYAIRAY